MSQKHKTETACMGENVHFDLNETKKAWVASESVCSESVCSQIGMGVYSKISVCKGLRLLQSLGIQDRLVQKLPIQKFSIQESLKTQEPPIQESLETQEPPIQESLKTQEPLMEECLKTQEPLMQNRPQMGNHHQQMGNHFN